MNRHFRQAYLVALLGISSALGCGMSQPRDDERVGAVSQAVYPGCATVSYDDAISSNYCSAEWSESPSTSYGHGASCPDRWVVEFTGSLGSIDSWGLDGWGDTVPTTATTCTQARWVSNAYDYNGTAWTERGEVTGQGSWDSGTSTCTFVWDDIYAADFGTGITKARVATWAYSHTRDGDIKKKARSWVMGTPCK